LIYNYYKDGDCSFEDFKRISQQDCHWCGSSVSKSGCIRFGAKSRRKLRDIPSANLSVQYHGMDRIDHNQPHNINNVNPCCWECNQKRADTPYDQYVEVIKSTYKIIEKRELDALLIQRKAS
jgi:hypothetical protein